MRAANHGHGIFPEAAAAAGKHVLREKPLATNLGDAAAASRGAVRVSEAGLDLQ
jgi:predicted dehydrogenase